MFLNQLKYKQLYQTYEYNIENKQIFADIFLCLVISVFKPAKKQTTIIKHTV